MGVNVEISGRENSKELLRPESMVKSLAFGQARWDDPLKDQEDQTIWLAKWEMSVYILSWNESINRLRAWAFASRLMHCDFSPA